MAPPPTFTQDFKHEFEEQTLRLLRARFLWFLGTVAAVYAVTLLLALAGLAFVAFGLSREVALQQLASFRAGTWGMVGLGCLIVMDAAVFVWCAREATARRAARQRLLTLTQQFFMYRGLSDLAAAYLIRSEGFPWYVGIYHVIACALLPWTPPQALRPMLFLLPLNAVLLIISDRYGWRGDLFWAVFSCFLAVPGLAIAWLKTGRRTEEFKMRFLQDRYGQMRRELVDARRLHEALFPRPITEGPIRFTYRYEPMRQIGGDYLYARFSPPPLETGEGEPAFNFLLIDVTGHGIAAALTVNRLYGEVERLFAEDPYSSPADVLAALNRYVHLTLARHSVFATALCIRIDVENDRVEYASGGHPPAFLCGADGRIHEMESTAFVLGAVAAGDFEPAMKRLDFFAGDSIIAYTDGAIEARNTDGRMLGVLGLQKALAHCLCAKTELAGQLLSHIEQHRHGPPEDDTLVVELSRGLGGLAVTERPGGLHPAAARPEVDVEAAASTISR